MVALNSIATVLRHVATVSAAKRVYYLLCIACHGHSGVVVWGRAGTDQSTTDPQPT